MAAIIQVIRHDFLTPFLYGTTFILNLNFKSPFRDMDRWAWCAFCNMEAGCNVEAERKKSIFLFCPF